MTTCERYAEQDAAERYVAGRMTADEAADFEQHFLACDACLATVRGIEDVRDVLAERRAAMARGEADPLPAAAPAAATVLPWSRKTTAWTAATWLAAAAALIAGVFWMAGGGLSRLGSSSSPGSPSSPVATVARTPAPSAAPAQAPSQTPSAPAPTPAPSPGTPPGEGPTALIARLAIVIPPPYVAVAVRGEGEGVQQAFAAAMKRYRASDYAGAATALRAIVEKSPDLAPAQFYLGISELMTRQPRRAETALRAAADSDVTPYADEAYFYLAKAALQRGDLAAAERALTEAVVREAGPGNEARRILEEVRALGRS